MSKTSRQEKTSPPSRRSPSRWREITGVVLVAAGFFLVLALVSYSPLDVSLNSTGTEKGEIRNLGGLVGAYLADLCLQGFGWAAFLIPFFFFFPWHDAIFPPELGQLDPERFRSRPFPGCLEHPHSAEAS